MDAGTIQPSAMLRVETITFREKESQRPRLGRREIIMACRDRLRSAANLGLLAVTVLVGLALIRDQANALRA